VDKRLPKHNFRLANHPTVPSERITSVRTFDGIVASIFSFLKKQERAEIVLPAPPAVDQINYYFSVHSDQKGV
jgi:hypothetical protein